MELQFLRRDGDAALLRDHNGVVYRVPMRARPYSAFDRPDAPHQAWFGVSHPRLWELDDYVGLDGLKWHVAASRAEALEFAFARLEELRTVHFIGSFSELERIGQEGAE